jgi:hypothetical protein
LLTHPAASREAANRWRATTIGILWRDEHRVHLQQEIEREIDAVVGSVNRILDAMTVPSVAGASTLAASGGAPPPSPTAAAANAAPPSRDATALRALVAGTAEVAHQLRSQRAVFRTLVPYGEPFDPVTMEDVSGEDVDDSDEEGSDGGGGAAAARRTVVCVLFPALVKNGDEKGERLDLENVIVKARVLCAAPGG